MSVAWIVVAVAVGTWLLAVVYQFGDLGTAWLDTRAARGSGRAARSLNRQFWLVPSAWLFLLGVALAVDYVGRRIFAADELAFGLILLLALAALSAGAAVAAIIVFTNSPVSGYDALRRELLAHEGDRIPASVVAKLREELTALDRVGTGLRLGPRDSSPLRSLRSRLEALVAETRLRPASPTSAVSQIRWAWATQYLVTSSPLRLVPVAFGLVLTAATIVAETSAPGRDAVWVCAASCLAPLVSFALSLASSRLSLAALVTAHARVLDRRAQSVRLLEELERSSRKGVAGLGDRVARALQILREQQS